jgi:hypothetical protein
VQLGCDLTFAADGRTAEFRRSEDKSPANFCGAGWATRFDPLIGAWKYHLKRRLRPLTGSTEWVELDGTGVCYKIWDGRAQLDTIEVDGPTGHIEGLTLRTYNPQSHQWRLYWANSRNGIMDPPQVGEFKDGRGEFYAQDTINGKTILI